MFPLFFGLGFASWLDSIFKSAVPLNTNSNFMSNNNISDEAFQFLGVYEDFKAKPYVNQNESLYTIGIGSTQIFDSNCANPRNVRSNDILTLSEAERQAHCYYKSSRSPKIALDRIIAKYGFKLNQRFYDMLCMAMYASRGLCSNANYYPRVIDVSQHANGSNDLEALSSMFLNLWVNYLKGYTKTGSYFINGLGWSRRALGGSQYIKGLDWSKKYTTPNLTRPY